MTRRQIVAAVAVVVVVLAAGVVVIQGPLYRRYSAEECHRAYASATTRGDTARVDLHPYAAPYGPRATHRCGEVRGRLIASDADILPR
jgi:hypothetical protein